VGQVRSGDPSGLNARTVPVVSVDTVEIGGARFEDLRGSVRDSTEGLPGETVDGILGFGLFGDCLLTLDYPGERVRLARGETPGGKRRRAVAPRTAAQDTPL